MKSKVSLNHSMKCSRPRTCRPIDSHAYGAGSQCTILPTDRPAAETICGRANRKDRLYGPIKQALRARQRGLLRLPADAVIVAAAIAR